MEYLIKFIRPFTSPFPQIQNGFRIQFKAPPNVPVRAMANGMILRASWDDPKDPTIGLGLRIKQIVSLPGFDSWMLFYGHLGELKSYIGASVKQGQMIALSGNKPLVVYLLDRNKAYKQIPFTSED